MKQLLVHGVSVKFGIHTWEVAKNKRSVKVAHVFRQVRLLYLHPQLKGCPQTMTQ